MGYDACKGGEEKYSWGFGRNTEREEAIWMTRHRLKDSTNIDIKELGCEGVKRFIWAMIAISSGAPVNMEISLWIPQNVETFFASQGSTVLASH